MTKATDGFTPYILTQSRRQTIAPAQWLMEEAELLVYQTDSCGAISRRNEDENED
ncbi:MAG: hypothetical protein IJ680_01670 [Paludibacteraceae bacterium]|nr:hypothetical protein [Paludibacteraceae bacterium]